MTNLQAIIMGLVQGVAEFLPISSSGHLAVLQTVFGLEEPDLTFDIVVHIGSLIAIMLCFWKDIWAILKKPFGRMTGLLIVGTIPAAIGGILFRHAIENYFRAGIWLAVAFTLTGFIMLLADKFSQSSKEGRAEITFLDAALIGLAQGFALLPGISRSGSTIAAALGRGVKREAAVKFSFMLAIIAIGGAGLLEAVQVYRGEVTTNVAAPQMIIGFVVSLVVGYLSIKLLLKLIESCKLKYFSFYVWGLAALIFVDWLFINRFF
ncbi:MAG: undecaprenyl-diphosphate phosphatase [Defluviitaleaceae bacterium]|nr:undecaprenyl-diphosphate phosphatase [Defluviitaleaceae bacterium]